MHKSPKNCFCLFLGLLLYTFSECFHNILCHLQSLFVVLWARRAEWTKKSGCNKSSFRITFSVIISSRFGFDAFSCYPAAILLKNISLLSLLQLYNLAPSKKLPLIWLCTLNHAAECLSYWANEYRQLQWTQYIHHKDFNGWRNSKGLHTSWTLQVILKVYT